MWLWKKPVNEPDHEEKNNKHKLQVLISTLCCVVLCLSFVVGTTWAWYTKTVSSAGNVLEIGEWTEETTEATEETTEETTGLAEDETTVATEETVEETTEETTAATVEEATQETTEAAMEAGSVTE